MGESLYGAACPEIRASDTDDYHEVDAFGLPRITYGFEIANQRFGNIYWKRLPTKEIAAGTFLALENVECVQRLSKIPFVIRCIDK